MYLIAHKVRGEPAFDVAIHMECPLCHADGRDPICDECDGEGYWWIIPTSGHRAYPYWHVDLREWDFWEHAGLDKALVGMPEGLPDHYSVTNEPAKRLDVIKLLGLRKTIERRI